MKIGLGNHKEKQRGDSNAQSKDGIETPFDQTVPESCRELPDQYHDDKKDAEEYQGIEWIVKGKVL